MQATLIAFALLVFANPCWADIYKWVDESGVAHFTDDPAQVPKSSKRASKPRNKTSAQYESALNKIWDVMEEDRTAKREEEIKEEPVGE